MKTYATFFQSDLSCSGGEQTTGGDSGFFNFGLADRHPSPDRRNINNNINNRNAKPSAPRQPISSPRRQNFIDRNFVDHAVVLIDYKKSTTTEISLAKSQVVQILDSKPGSEWWRVRDDSGREGYYPSNFLKLI